MDRDLVAGNAELRFGDRLKVYSFTVDVDTRSRLISARLDVIRVGVRDYFLNSSAAAAAVHWLKDVALKNAPLGVYFGVLLIHPMADDAGDAFARHLRFLPQRHVARLVHRRANASVAAHAKVTDGSLGQVVDFLLELVKDRRDRSVGVVGGAPFVIDLLMTCRAFRGAGVMAFRKQIRMRIDRIRELLFQRRKLFGWSFYRPVRHEDRQLQRVQNLVVGFPGLSQEIFVRLCRARRSCWFGRLG